MDTRGSGNVLPGESISIAAAVRSASFAISHTCQSQQVKKKLRVWGKRNVGLPYGFLPTRFLFMLEPQRLSGLFLTLNS